MFPQHVEVLTVIEITFLNILNLKKKIIQLHSTERHFQCELQRFIFLLLNGSMRLKYH